MDEILSLDDGLAYGILTRASGPAKGVTLVLLNAGLIHRPGPFRFHVHLARALAEEGFNVFRFDQPRVGDAGSGSHATAGALFKQVLDTLQTATADTQFAIGGICSAADQAWRLALADQRVTSLVLIDGMAVQNIWFRVGQLRLMLGRGIRRWPGMLKRFLAARDVDAPGVMDFRDWSEPAQFREEAALLLQRGVKILGFYTGGVSYYLLHRRQLDATFGRSRRHPGLTLLFRPDVDHILFSTVQRERVIQRIRAWMTEL
ncbi:alpha/beta fold hydrolase [Pseudoxanthomonas dokdonensis]|uniref:AB hydrolase-1 domain-containing protein n=1 Tax=Pseudoxanthomonas dokdonensis TaxID=344882 RepID=A0A0R0CGN1_9GAMM|nr:alpha/beta fold hydrolase [Pseudoxanthomonas dokdonensis]KRG68957.1 hypothetical protein ABB29_10915 [Pseudoxanthomonas dokdonensis]